jgi:hypothetical protein
MPPPKKLAPPLLVVQLDDCDATAVLCMEAMVAELPDLFRPILWMYITYSLLKSTTEME